MRECGTGHLLAFPSEQVLERDDQCVRVGSVRGGGFFNAQGIGADGYVYTALGEAAAQTICAAAHADGREYTAQQQALNLNLHLCVAVVPTAMNTAIPPSSTPITPTAPNTLIPPTNTTVPPTPANTRAIAAVRLSSAIPGELSAEWDAPGETARDYRVSWAKVGEAFRTWTDLDYNAYPTAASLTISGLDGGSRYKVMVRARYDGGAGPWTGEVEATVMDEGIFASYQHNDSIDEHRDSTGQTQRLHRRTQRFQRQIHWFRRLILPFPATNTAISQRQIHWFRRQLLPFQRQVPPFQRQILPFRRRTQRFRQQILRCRMSVPVRLRLSC